MKFIRCILVFFSCLILLYLLRVPIMQGMSSFLIREDPIENADALFLLSGGAGDRSREAACTLREGFANQVICTGESIPWHFQFLDTLIDEAQLSYLALREEMVPDSQIILYPKGTSTREESSYILDYCRAHNYKKVIVISDKFHTNRINYAFRKLFEEAGIRLILRGAPSTAYNERSWWTSESGLLMVNNEYVKLMWYWWRY